jgi:hypothetical protein
VILAPLFATVAGLLALAGVLKLRSPVRGSEAYPAPGAALGVHGARAVGAVELLLGAAAIALPGRLLAAAIGAAFLAFAAYTMRMVAAADAPADCGCFGEAGGSVGAAHVVLDLACAAVALAAVVSPPRALAALVADAPLTGVAVAAGVAAAVYAVYLAYTALPSAWGAYAGGRTP